MKDSISKTIFFGSVNKKTRISMIEILESENLLFYKTLIENRLLDDEAFSKLLSNVNIEVDIKNIDIYFDSTALSFYKNIWTGYITEEQFEFFFRKLKRREEDLISYAMCADIMIGFSLFHILRTYIKVPSIRGELLAVILSKYTPVGLILRAFYRSHSILHHVCKSAYFRFQIILFRIMERLNQFVDNTEY